jgi:hypothetical protein
MKPDLAVNESERMRLTAFRVIAGKQRNWEGFWQVQNASLEQRVDAPEWVNVMEVRTPAPER